MYNPTLGRWMQEDPIGFEGGDTNLYRYVGNSPTGTLDPLGLQGVNDGTNYLQGSIRLQAAHFADGKTDIGLKGEVKISAKECGMKLSFSAKYGVWIPEKNTGIYVYTFRIRVDQFDKKTGKMERLNIPLALQGGSIQPGDKPLLDIVLRTDPKSPLSVSPGDVYFVQFDILVKAVTPNELKAMKNVNLDAIRPQSLATADPGFILPKAGELGRLGWQRIRLDIVE